MKNYFTKSDLVKYFPFTKKEADMLFDIRGFPKERIRRNGRNTDCVEALSLISFLNYLFG